MKTVSKLGVLALYLVFSVLFAYSAKIPEGAQFTAAILPAAFFALSTALLAVAAITPVDVYYAIPAITISSVLFPVFFGFSIGPAALTLSYFLGALLFFFEVRKDSLERLKLSVGKSIEAGLSLLFTFFLIGAAIFAYVSVSDSGKTPADFVPDQLYSIALSATSQAMASELNCTLDMTVDSCVDKLASTEVARNIAQCNGLPLEQKALCVSQVEALVGGQLPAYKAQVKQKIIDEISKTAKGTDRLSDIISNSETLKSGLKARLETVFAPIARYMPLLAALIVFSTLNFASFPIGFLAKILAGFFVSGSVAAGLVEKKTVEVEAEVLE